MADKNFTAGDDTKAKSAKAGGSTRPKRTASTPDATQLGRVLQFTKRKTTQIKLIDQLEILLSQAKAGEICSLAYLVELGNRKHRYGMVGEYVEHPDDVFIPASKALYGLCTHIHDRGFML